MLLREGYCVSELDFFGLARISLCFVILQCLNILLLDALELAGSLS